MHFLNAGDRALVVEFGDTIDQQLLAQVSGLNDQLTALHAANEIPGFLESVPTFRSLAILFNPLETTHDDLVNRILALPPLAQQSAATAKRHWCLPVCYGGDVGPDLDEVATATGLSPDDVIALHSGVSYSVYMLGFLPGFAFMGDTPKALQLPRRAEPRTAIPRGSVAVAMQLTSVYPWQSPGGWHLLGRCPVPMFDATLDDPILLTANDKVQFEPISSSALTTLQDDIDAGRFDRRSLQQRSPPA